MAAQGVSHYVIQAFRSQGCQDADLCRNAIRDRPLRDVGEGLTGLLEDFSVRAT